MRHFGGKQPREQPFGGTIQGFRGAIATEHTLSALAGADLLKQGGNAFDAAAAATFVETVVNPHMATIGGECPMLVYPVEQARVIAVNGNTQVGAGATLAAYRARGLKEVPPEGVLAAGVPALFSALGEMLARFGGLPLEAVLQPALELARDGFPLHQGLLHMPRFSLAANRAKFIEQWPATAALYLEPDGALPPLGKRIRNPALAGMLGLLADEAGRAGAAGGRAAGIRAALNAFYRGDIAAEIAAFVRHRDGFLERDDLARFETRFEPPVAAHFQDTTVFKCGPWSQGPVFLQLLKLLEGFDLRSLGHNSAAYLHLWVEAAKFAYADREQYYADPERVAVPMDALLSADYADQRRRLIDPDRANAEHRPGDPVGGRARLPAEQVFMYQNWGFGTVHVAVIDHRGNMAALTPSGGWLAGNEVIPTLGFPLTSRAQTFFLDPRHPNVLAPGKRPRTTLSPSLAFRRGRPWMVFGTMGGDQQDQWTSQFFLNRVVFGMALQEAIEAPKVTCDHIPGTFHPHDMFPRRIRPEGRIAAAVRDQLSARGHLVEADPDWIAGYICAVERGADGLLEAGCDPRGRKAGVFPSCALAW